MLDYKNETSLCRYFIFHIAYQPDVWLVVYCGCNSDALGVTRLVIFSSFACNVGRWLLWYVVFHTNVNHFCTAQCCYCSAGATTSLSLVL